jgi:hypothetical protein
VEYSLRLLRDTARQSSQQVFTASEAIREQLDDLPTFANVEQLQVLGHHIWTKNLYVANEALMLLTELSEALLRREQGAPEIPDEGLMELRVDTIKAMELEAYKNAGES